jgi:hypothetical protein
MRKIYGDEYGMGFTIALTKHHCHGNGRFEQTIICGDCNAADGAVKRKLKLPHWWSYAPHELRQFVRIAPQTHYRGYRFRSRLEARWAVFFDAAGIEWQYEVEGFNVNGTYYLPDFWLPGLKTFVEIKPDTNSAFAAESLLRDLVNAQNCHGIIIFDRPNVETPPEMLYLSGNNVSGRWLGNVGSWLECIFCHHVRLENVDGMRCHCPVGIELLSGRNTDLRINHALSEAQPARFEHGEDGTPRPFVAHTITEPATVYLAGAVSEIRRYSHGKIEEFLEWRREIFPRGKGGNSWLDMQPGERWESIIYGGPRIESGNHGEATGCIHGRETAGLHSGENSKIAERCLEQLHKCNVLFVWIDRIETVGTMIEIGAALGRMPIFVTFADRVLAKRAYFAAQLADVAVVAPSAVDAWKLFLQWWAVRQISNPQRSF